MCTSVLTVEDNDNPQALCADITIQFNDAGEASIVGHNIDHAGSNDACISIIGKFGAAFDCSDVGPKTITVTNSNSNFATCTYIVTTEDIFN
jgi:hypothetical protein